MSKLEDLRKKHAQAEARATREENVLPSLPVEPRSLCAHDGKRTFISLSYEVATLADALKIYESFAPHVRDCEAWKSSCLAIRPREINTVAEEESARLEFVSHAQFTLHSYGHPSERFYQDTVLEFWARIGEGEWLSVDVKATKGPWPVTVWTPSEAFRKDQGKDWRINYPDSLVGADNVRGWWSEKPCYRRTYHWADAHNFRAAMSHTLHMLETKGHA